jgi:hypothetical protein
MILYRTNVIARAALRSVPLEAISLLLFAENCPKTGDCFAKYARNDIKNGFAR